MTHAAPTLPTETRAWTQRRYGGAEVLERRTVALPPLDPDQVLIETAGSSINAADRYMVSCPALAMRPMFGLRRPRRTTPGLDVSGTVVAIGSSVTEFAVGDVVLGEANGAWADHVVASPRHLSVAPTSIPLVDAGAIAVGGLTALQGLRDHGGVGEGSTVLIHGATGAVGAFAVQIAAALGASVTAICRADHADLVRSLGADEVLDRNPTDGTVGERLVAAGRRFDTVLDVAGVESTRTRGRLLTDDGVCVLVGAPGGGPVLGPIRPLVGTMLTGLVVRGRFRSFTAKANAADLATLAAMIDAGSLRVVVDDRFDAADLPAAFERFAEHGRTGKVLVDWSTGGDDRSGRVRSGQEQALDPS